MNDQYASWSRGPHHGAARCVDCHLPHEFIGKYVAKAVNGYHHSKGFTLQDFHEPILDQAADFARARAAAAAGHRAAGAAGGRAARAGVPSTELTENSTTTDRTGLDPGRDGIPYKRPVEGNSGHAFQRLRRYSTSAFC